MTDPTTPDPTPAPPPPADPSPVVHVPCIGGPMHMQTVRAPRERGMPISNLATLAYPLPVASELDSDRRIGGERFYARQDSVLYWLGPARIDDTGQSQNVYRYTGKERESWGYWDEIRDLDDMLDRRESIGADIAWATMPRDPEHRSRQDRWAIILPPHEAPTVTVYRTLPVIHSHNTSLPMLVLRPPFPMWIDERLY